MAYTAIENMRKHLEADFGKGIGPADPYRFGGQENGNDMKSAALRFIHDRCEDLRFDRQIEAQEARTGVLQGSSIAPNQIPYNMQKDIDRLCLERELECFIDSGTAEDAYNVYYCYLEMFFGSYASSKQMVELLNEYELNGSSLLMKHRDHYSHSVYVFTLGLAIYETNVNYRRVFNAYYGFDADGDARSSRAASFFLEYWGLAALFHDIGYPFELAYEQVMSYMEASNQQRGEKSLLLAYTNASALTELSNAARIRFERLYGKTFHTITEVIAYDITVKLGAIYGFSEGYIMQILDKKPSDPECFNYFMDHAFFSAVRLYRELDEVLNDPGRGEEAAEDRLSGVHIDVLSAILLHNSLYKFSIAFYKDKSKGKPPLSMDAHPLAWLLMICDELQCWDRTAYGRNSRTELSPMAVEFDFSSCAISARYLYDEEEKEKMDSFHKAYEAWIAGGRLGKAPKLRAYSDMADEGNSFAADIRRIVDTSLAPLSVSCDTCTANRKNKHMYLSSSSFLHLHDFAAALNGRYAHEGHEDEISAKQLEDEFNALSLEYKIYNINQAKSFSRYLNVIRCFYTDRPVAFELVTAFTREQIARFAPIEHERWVRAHQAMGWKYGTEYEDAKVPDGKDPRQYASALREQMRCHKLTMDGDLTQEQIRRHYEDLPEAEKEKDWKPFNSMLKLIRKFDGLLIYKLDEEAGEKDNA
ncbi:MAG: hypothetical protein J5859_05190 [Clostridia bacterium]|nr:hypothetical protein [Clostridia bacterium]